MRPDARWVVGDVLTQDEVGRCARRLRGPAGGIIILVFTYDHKMIYNLTSPWRLTSLLNVGFRYNLDSH